MIELVTKVNDVLSVMYSIAPKEIWIIIFASIIMYAHLEYTDWKNKKKYK